MKQTGLTLIEVLIVLALVALIALVAAPLSGTWVRESNLLSVESQLTQAIGQARAAGLRNAKAATGDNTPVAIICIANAQLTLRERSTANDNPNCSNAGVTLWETTLASQVSITPQGSSDALSCLCFNNRGLVTKAPQVSSCSSCATSTAFTLTAGTTTENVVIH